MKKMMRHILFSFAILAGIVMAGVNPASADTLKDVNGNNIVAGQEYYLESYEYPWFGMRFEEWGGGLWASLGSPYNEQETVKVIQSGNSVKFETDELGWEYDMFGGIVWVPLYLSIDDDNDGVALSKGNLSYPEWWIPTVPSDPFFAGKNFFAFKNYKNNKFMSHSDGIGWLYASKSNMDIKTMWCLTPKP
ncbi:hypothetical protein BK704_13765 [[Bacillus thuringiensis] serovar konkukian]|nr:hypothetical protein [Bacillus thuringiensis]MED1300234.1 hypothetical protein [Bacillus pacificus]OUB07502.1 hypothetical protein BK704_13765 [[Bacillus thuringiensis] serovar konkukian]